uniref:DDHD domain-containing protein n=1 Tax=Elaeophora elaphi TaxID=1147741 RepID=A0A0R3RT61_9BILA
MSSVAATIAQEVTEDSQLDEDRTPDGKELMEQVNDVYATPIAELFPVVNENLSATEAPISGSIDTTLSSKPLLTQIEDFPVVNNSQRIPLVPPRHRKRRVAELKCSEVRWFHRKSGTETKWTAFKGADSLLLEVYWRQQMQIDLDQATESYMRTMKMPTSVVVLNGLYRASEDLTMLNSIYWKDDTIEIRRGTWFLLESLQPIDPSMADPIERHHLHIFRSQTIPDAPVFSEKESSKKPILAELKLQDQYEVRWNSVIDITLYNNSKTSRLLRYIAWGKGTPLKRGYEEAEWDDGKRIIKHLILVVHGIGQKGYENLIAKNTDQVREAIYNCMDKHYPGEKSRPMVLPVEWRAALVLDDGITDYVTLPKMSSMRNTLNSTAMDIMYYQSPLYRNEIMDGLIRSLNNVYSLFIENYPDFDGPISIYAHSLGSVMCYDLLTCWSPLVLYDKYVAEMIEQQLAIKAEHAEILNGFREARLKLLELYGGFQLAFVTQKQKLKFKVRNMFCVGSPLAVFLIMRGSTTFVPETDSLKRIYNIFHPYDPVAYRLEPLVHKQYRLIRPIKLFSSIDLRSLRDYALLPPEINKAYIKKIKIKEKVAKEKDARMVVVGDKDHEEIEEEDECESDDSSALRPSSPGSSPRSLTPPPSESGDNKKSWWKFGSSRKEKESNEGFLEEVKLNEAQKLMEGIPPEERLPYRMDYQVQPQITDRSYWSVLKSHFAYWNNPDIAAFLVNCLYREDKKQDDKC